MARTGVFLNIYDMYWLNEYASNVGVGVYHSGVEIYGIEYAYGGHPLPFSGIFENTPRDANELGENFKFRESIMLGETDFSATEVKRMIQLMGEEYRGDRYHLISKNCNHFTSALAKTLTGTDIPSWVNRLATISGSIPFLERWIPAEWLTPIALQQSLEEKSKMARGNTRRSQYSDPSTSTTNGNDVGGASSASWKWFQRRASSSSVFTTAVETTARSAPNTARSGMNSNSVDNASSSSSSGQSLTKLWNSIKNIASSATDSCSPASSSSSSLKKPADQRPRSPPTDGKSNNQ